MENCRMKRLVTALMLLSLALCAFASDGGVRTVLPSLAGERPQLPIDTEIGQLGNFRDTREHEVLTGMLFEPYSFEWTERHLAQESREALVRLFGTWMSENLPASEMLISESRVNEDGSTVINVRLHGTCMAFVLRDGVIVSMKEL